MKAGTNNCYRRSGLTYVGTAGAETRLVVGLRFLWFTMFP